MTHPCKFCSATSLLCCGRCRTPYCGPDHQRADWPTHKLVCKELAQQSQPADPAPPPNSDHNPTERSVLPDAAAAAPPAEAPSDTNRTCLVCFTDIAQLEPGSCRDHPACRRCLKTWLKECIDTRRIPDLPCVDSSCKFVQPLSLLEAVHNNTMVQKYLDRSAFLAVSRLGRLVTCPQCPHLLLLEHGTVLDCKTLRCRCGVEFCLGCSRRAHAGECSDHALDADSKATADFLAAYTKPCITCAWPIQKNGGCHQMTCSQCKKVFCWICAKEISGNDHSACPSKLAAETEKIDRELAMLRRKTESDVLKTGRLEELFERRIEGASKQLTYLKHQIAVQQAPSAAAAAAPPAETAETTLPSSAASDAASDAPAETAAASPVATAPADAAESVSSSPAAAPTPASDAKDAPSAAPAQPQTDAAVVAA